jgi:hypothetical protein
MMTNTTAARPACTAAHDHSGRGREGRGGGSMPYGG